MLVPKSHLRDPWPLHRVPPSGIKVTSTVTTKTVKAPPQAIPQDGTGQEMKAMVQDMIRSSLTQFWVIPQQTPTQPPIQSITMDPESPQIVEISDSEQEGPDSWIPELDQLVLTEEE